MTNREDIHNFPIIIRTYQRPEYLERVIESYETLNELNWDLVHFFDDGSTNPKTIERLKQVLKRRGHVHFLQHRGELTSRITAIKIISLLYPDVDWIGDFESDAMMVSQLFERWQTYKDLDITLISLFNFWFKRLHLGTEEIGNEKYHRVAGGGGVAYMLRRDLIEIINKMPHNHGEKAVGGDRFIMRYNKQVGGLMAIVDPTIVEHIGDEGTYGNRRPIHSFDWKRKA